MHFVTIAKGFDELLSKQAIRTGDQNFFTQQLHGVTQTGSLSIRLKTALL
jgi:hypothetical protein